MRLSPLILLASVATAAGWTLAPAEADTGPVQLGQGPVHVLPFGLMHHVRELDHVVPMQVQVYHAGEGSIHLDALVVRSVDGRELARTELYGERLLGDEGALFDVHRLLESLPVDVSHRRGDRMFLPIEEIPELDGGEIADIAHDIEGRIEEIRHSGMAQARNVTFDLDLASAFPSGAVPGDEVVLDLELIYAGAAGAQQTVEHVHSITLLPKHLGPPEVWTQRYGARAAGAFAAGDLHVHNCRDQATLGCPNCAAESFNVTGAFTNRQLRDQFMALGYDYFSTTTHSYCINGSSEFASIASESVSLDLPDFVVLLGTEMTNLETGPQQGSDIFDATCVLGGQLFRGIAHMGAHGITSDKPGGRDYFLGACDGPIRDQEVNVRETVQEGGFAIANHPGGDTISYNSVAYFEGMEANRTKGVEIWNYDISTGAASVVHKQWWLARLNEGKITYPYSGSDTHDEAVEFGATITYVEGPLNDQNVLTSLKAGRNYISNGPFLYNNLTDGAGRELVMGDIRVLRPGQIPPNYPVSIDSYYNLGTDVATVRVYQGAVGFGEQLVAEYTQVTGQGVLQTSTTVPTSASSWYRTELEVDGAPRAAYATPCYIYLR